MLNIFSLISGAMSLAKKAFAYFKDKQLIDAGRDKQRVEAFHEKEKRVKRADAVRDSVTLDGMSDDPNNRG